MATDRKAALAKAARMRRSVTKSLGSGSRTKRNTNLTAAQLKAAGARKAAAKRTVSQSDTKRDYGTGFTRTSSGKKLTGTVKLANGGTAVYKGGKRVLAPKKAKPASGGSSRAASGNDTSVTSLAGKNAAKNFAPGTKKRGPNGKWNVVKNGKWVPVASATTGQTAAQKAAAKSQGISSINSRPVNTPKSTPKSPTSVPAKNTGGAMSKAATTPRPSRAAAAAKAQDNGTGLDWKLPDDWREKPAEWFNNWLHAGSKPAPSKPTPKSSGSQVPDVGKALSGIASAVSSAAAGSNKKKK